MEFFSFLDPLREAGFVAEFVSRVPDCPLSYDKEEVLTTLEPIHREVVADSGYQWAELWRAEQVHGSEIALIDEELPGRIIPGVDGLMSSRGRNLLGIYVADCGLIWIGDRRTGAFSLLHSGKKGTEGRILSRAVQKMGQELGSVPADLLVVLGPCIRPPHYEIDFAVQIAEQAKEAGVGLFHDCGICTGADQTRFYSYRQEKGLTGRMLGLMGSAK